MHSVNNPLQTFSFRKKINSSKCILKKIMNFLLSYYIYGAWDKENLINFHEDKYMAG